MRVRQTRRRLCYSRGPGPWPTGRNTPSSSSGTAGWWDGSHPLEAPAMAETGSLTRSPWQEVNIIYFLFLCLVDHTELTFIDQTLLSKGSMTRQKCTVVLYHSSPYCVFVCRTWTLLVDEDSQDTVTSGPSSEDETQSQFVFYVGGLPPGTAAGSLGFPASFQGCISDLAMDSV